MPVDLHPLLEPLSVNENAELEALDERLVAIDALADKARFADAAAAVQELVGARIYDIRPLPYLFHQAFLERGLDGLCEVFAVLENLLGQSFVALSPERRREEYVNKRLTWLFETVQRALEYHEKFATAEWVELRRSLSPAQLARALEAGVRLAQRLAPSATSAAGSALGQLMFRLRSYEQAAKLEERPASPTPPNPPAPELSPQHLPPLPVRVTDALSRDGLFRVELLAAQPFLDLCKRLQAFELLVQEEKFQKAAVLAEEIARAVEQFDPQTHFPSLFSKFAALQSKHVGALTEEAQAHDSPVWRALSQHARIDLTSFVEN